MFAYGLGDGWNIWDKAFFGFMGVLGLAATVYGLAPLELTTDAEGIRYRGLGYDRTFRWSDIEAIGVANDRNFDGWDAPVVRVLTHGGPSRIPPAIGINLKLGDRNPATVAYRRGASGYEIRLQNAFDRGVRGVVSDLQVRLEQSRNDASIAILTEVVD